MGNDIGYYFGPYLRIEVNQILREDWQRVCANKHKVTHDKFCSLCGKSANRVLFIKYDTPTLYDIFGDVEHYDYLSDTTPKIMRDEGKYIIARDNTGDAEGWLSLDKWSTDVETKSFPTFSEIKKMRDSFQQVHDARIAEIVAHEIVVSATIETGFLLDLEY